MAYPHNGAKSLLTPRETLMDIVQAHIAFFHDIGGVPETIFYDNPRTIILNPNTTTWNPTFLAFAAHYGFTPPYLHGLGTE